MPLVMTPVGEYENAFFHFNGQKFQPQYLGRDYGYYGVLARQQPKDRIDRIATFSVISDRLQIAGADWSFRRDEVDTPDKIQAEFGLAMSHDPIGEWDNDTEALGAMLIAANAIPKMDLERITKGLKRGKRQDLKLGLKGRWDTYHYVCRLIHQLRTSQSFSSTLLISDEDRKLIETLSSFMKSERWPLPFEWPDPDNYINPSKSPYGLLLFSPPDYDALLAARRNKDVARYAMEVRKHIKIGNERAEVQMIKSMKDAIDKKDIIEHCEGVFEAESWGWRVMHFLPVLDKIAIFGELVAELCGRWAKRKKKECEWYAIGPKMQTIAIEDYLKRKDNIA